MADPGASLDSLGLEDSDDDFQYEEVEVLSDDEDVFSEDLESALRSLQQITNKKADAALGGRDAAPAPGQVTRKPEVIDDFIRNFLVKMGLSKTVEAFEAEWYERKATGQLNDPGTAPDVYLRNAELEDEVLRLRQELLSARQVAGKASATWDKFRKERDYHRMHHKRVAQEKNKLIGDIKRLKEHYGRYEPTILELKKKYESLVKEKALVTMERDRAMARVSELSSGRTLQPSELDAARAAAGGSLTPPPGAAGGGGRRTTESPAPGRQTLSFSPDRLQRAGGKAGMTFGGGGGGGATRWASLPAERINPLAGVTFDPVMVKNFFLQKTFKGHMAGVANLALHPTKPILVTASDDKTWKMWHLPNGDLIMCGEGHKDWVSGVDFHPKGTSLVSGSGDGQIKVWDFEQQKCVATYADHKQAVWAVKHHDLGDFVASASLDHTVRLWDLGAGKCKTVLRGHMDSVNDICWQMFTNHLASAGADKTVSVWDARSGLCMQTLYGHKNSCNGVAINLAGTTIASTDADGQVKLWDVRMVAEIATIDTGKAAANKVAFDRSGQVLLVACDDAKLKAYHAVSGEPVAELTGHEDAVQGVAFDPAGQYVVSCGSDCTFRVWG